LRGGFARAVAAVSVAFSFLAVAAPARAVTISLFGVNSTSSGSITSFDGEAAVNGSAPLVFFPSQTTPFSFVGSYPVNSAQLELQDLVEGEFSGPDNFTLTNLTGFDLDLFGSEFPSETNFASVGVLQAKAGKNSFFTDVGVGGRISDLVFSQTGGATFTPSTSGTGTFSIPGHATLSLGLFAAESGFFGLDLGTPVLTIPLNLTGEYTVSTAGFGNRKVFLEWSATPVFPLSLASTLVNDDATIDFAMTASIGLSLNYSLHLNSDLIPEPGSITLLAIGAALIMPLALARSRRSRR
jgi:hypothetical protein